MPTPKKDEKKGDFISRCMEYVSKEEDKKDWTKEHKLGYCYGIWKDHAKSEIEKNIQSIIRKLNGINSESI